MSDFLFPSLDGVVQVARHPFFVNHTQTADNGARLTVKKRSDPGYRYSLEVRALRPWLYEPATLFSFFELHAGSYESWLYVDTFDSTTRRVRFVDDELNLTRLNGGVYKGSIEIETTVPLVGGTGTVYSGSSVVYTKAEVPAASASARLLGLIRVRDPGEPEELWICRMTAADSYEWSVVHY